MKFMGSIGPSASCFATSVGSVSLAKGGDSRHAGSGSHEIHGIGPSASCFATSVGSVYLMKGGEILHAESVI